MSTQDMKLPVWFWIVGALALVWNGMGVLAFFAEMNQTPEVLAAMSETQRNLYETRPTWALIAFAVAVFGGLLGCILLLLRRKLATVLFMVSLIALVVQNYYSFGVAKVQDVYTENVMVLPIAVVVIAIALVWFSRSASAKNWLR